MRALPVLTLLALVLAGCATPAAEQEPDGLQPGSSTVEAPWWPVGAWWDVRLQQAGEPTRTSHLVHYWNDSETHHFWLGVRDRSEARDHALHDTNPLLGRIHWGLLTPHEKGIHAQGLYTFPTEPGDSFGGLAFGRTWDISVSAGEKSGALVFEGRSTEGDTIRYDYDPALQWFSFIEIQDERGATVLRADVTAHGVGETGRFEFLRGRDYYEGPQAQGTHDETFEVEEEDIPHAALAVEVTGKVTGGFLRLDFLSPTMEIKHSETLTGGDVSRILEIPNPAKGKWTLRYVGTGTFDGVIEATGLLDYGRAA